MTEPIANDEAGKNLESAKNNDGGTEQSDTQEKVFQIAIESVKVESASSFPIEIDIAAEYQNIFAAGILRNVDYINLYDTLCEILFSDRGIKLGQLLFWMVFCTKFQPESEFLPQLRQRIGKLYIKVFNSLPTPKDSLTNLMVFVIAYAIHITFWDAFTNRELFNMRFILDCYHIVLFELNGVFVSDHSIQYTIEKLFGSKFFFYEQKQDKQKKKPEIKDRKDQPLIRDLNFNPDSLFNIDGGIEFAAELSSKLRDKVRRFNPDSPLEKSKLHGSPRKSALTIGADTSIMSNQQKKGAESKARSSMETQDTITASNNDEQPESENRRVYFPKIRFDCTQISPTVLRFLNTTSGKTISQKKKLTIHTDNKQLTAMRNYKVSESIDNILTVHPVIHEKKKNKKDNFMRDYDLKNRPDDYYLEYLPKKLRDRFKEELDLKYVLDNVGTYSLKPKKLQLEEKYKEKEYEKAAKIAVKFYSSKDNQGTNLTSSPQRDGEIAEPEVKSVELDSPEVGNIKKNLITQFAADNGSYESASASNLLLNKKKDEFTFESKNLETSAKNLLAQDSSTSNLFKHMESEEVATPLLVKKFNKNQKKNLLLPLLRASNLEQIQQQKDGTKENRNKSDYIPERKMKLQIIDLQRNERRKADFFEYETQQEKKKSEIFVYEDRRKKYHEAHGKHVHRSVDANINDLVTRVLQTKKEINARNNFGNIRPRR